MAFTQAVGTKFHEDGSLRRFPGNTIICFTVDIEPLQSEIIWAQKVYRELSFAENLAFLPPSSFHMTLFDLVCDQVRLPEHWTTKLPLDAPLKETDAFFEKELGDFPFPESIHMALDDMEITGLQLKAATDAEADKLVQLRHALSEKTGVRHPNHDRYRFHITLAYVLKKLTQAEKDEFAALRERLLARMMDTVGTFTLGKPQFVVFEDMGAYSPNIVR